MSDLGSAAKFMKAPFALKLVGVPSFEKPSVMPPSMALEMVSPDVVATRVLVLICSARICWLSVGMPLAPPAPDDPADVQDHVKVSAPSPPSVATINRRLP